MNHNEKQMLVNANQTCKIRFWEGLEADINLDDIRQASVPVKGVSFESPLRFLELFLDDQLSFPFSKSFDPGPFARRDFGRIDWEEIKATFFPRLPGISILLAENLPQPPFTWKDAVPRHLCVNFTYNTNAFYRILSNLAKEGLISKGQVNQILDQACWVLARIYKARDHFLLRNINNNFNMYLISKVIEFLLGKDCYDSERQEVGETAQSLAAALTMAPYHANASVIEKMGIALGRGVSFIESHLQGGCLLQAGQRTVQEAAFRYFECPLAIDHRSILVDMVVAAGLNKGRYDLAVILDDTAESVDDLLWLLDLMERYPFFTANLIVNRAQISINFSSYMLKTVFEHQCFQGLVARRGAQLRVTEIFCPFISYQTNFLDSNARHAIDQADAVFIKGANFFETCQIVEKHTFYGFVVFGPISRVYTGLQDYDAVFAYVPAGISGYQHDADPTKIIPLIEIVGGLAPVVGSCAPEG